MNIKITSDSTCDLSPDLLVKYDVTLVPLTITKGGGRYADGVDIRPADIFQHVAAGGDLCATSAVNVWEYQEVFQKYAREADAVVHVTLGSGFSSCYQNACQAAEGFANVFVVDSQNLSSGHGHIVVQAGEMRAACGDLQGVKAMCGQLRALTARVEASFILDRLDYMRKGGRCSSLAALGANMFQLKPCIQVVGGKMTVGKKYRGAYAACIASYIRDRLAGLEDVDPKLLFITHTPVADDALAAARAAVNEYGGAFAEVVETEAGCTVSCHCGPGTLGVLFICL